MKICYISTKSIHTRKWVEYFVGRGHEVHLITQKYDNYCGVKTHVVDPKLSKLSPFFKVIKIRNLIKKIKPDILHVHQVFPFGLYGALSGYHPFILSPWGSDIAVTPERYGGLPKPLISFILGKADLVNFSDFPTKKRLIELGCDERKLISCCTIGVDSIKFSHQAKSEKLRRELEIREKFSILNACHLRPTYNVDVFIKAIPDVLRKIKDIKFIVLGSGYLEKELKNLAKKLDVEKNITFLGGVPYKEMPKYLASVDVYVDTIKESDKAGGGIGATSLETMMCETPMIMTEKPYDKNFWRDLNILSCEPLNHQDVAKKIIFLLLKDEKFRREMGSSFRDIAIKIGDWKTIMEKWENIYQTLIPKFGIKREKDNV